MLSKVKNIAIYALLGGLVACSSQEGKQNQIQIKGEVFTGSSQDTLHQVFLDVVKENEYKTIDTAQINEKGQFSFEVEPANEFGRIRFENNNSIPIYVDSSLHLQKIDIYSPIAKYDLVEGSKVNREIAQFLAILRDFNMVNDSLQREYIQAEQAGDEERKAALEEVFRKSYYTSVEKTKALINTLIPSVSVIYAASLLNMVDDGTFLKELAEKMQKAYQGKPMPSAVKRFIDYMSQVSLSEDVQSAGPEEGSMAPDFSLPQADGTPFSLSKLRGKYVLVDFWASWCGPCRKENPQVVALYNKYKDKGFEILGVSLDEDKEAWLKAIEKDRLTWIHVSDLKGWQNEAARLYNVNAIPMTYLIDPDGVIIAKGLRGPALEAKLQELLGK
ncbi:MAG: thiol:disulfide interchange protein [Thermonema sp.]|uniref:peroxiredoxin family protein n=1 Tax=Thermonema sp. TaxID=2231181 RepID=UPI0021DEB301|nr:TlpA disulfide reductase family protein [Thermonema sp.]GIV38578.1 MAG: thiol:disulfide interchange protein [Thermonema sp.]